MEYLVLWSGKIRGARKTRIGTERAHLFGHYVDGIPLTFDGSQFRNAIAPQHRRAWDEGRCISWLDKHALDSPWVIRFYDTRGKPMAVYYCQPLTRT